MLEDSQIRNLAYEYFLEEIPGLLETIEQELLALENDSELALRVNDLMRATHTIKGGAANVGLKNIETVSHQLEDILKGLYNPELTIDCSLKTLLFDSYECLRLLLSAQIDSAQIDETEILKSFAAYFTELELRLGEYAKDGEAFPNSQVLGTDPVKTFLETVVTERLAIISKAIDNLDNNKISALLEEQAIVFRGMGRSLQLPGFVAIAQTVLTSLENSPQQANLIAKIALQNFQSVKAEILSGRPKNIGAPAFKEENILQLQLEKLSQFIAAEFDKPELYLLTVKCILGWFNCYENIPLERLNLDAIAPIEFLENTKVARLKIEKYLENWLSKFYQYIQIIESEKSSSLNRKLIISQAILAVIKFQYLQQFTAPKTAEELPIIRFFSEKIAKLEQQCQQNQLNLTEQNWLNSDSIRDLIKKIDRDFEVNQQDFLADIWQDKNQLELFFNPVTETETIKTQNSQELKTEPIKIEKDKILTTVKVKIKGLEKINYLAGEISIEQNKNSVNNRESQVIIEEVLAKTKQNQQALNQLCNWFDLALMFPDNYCSFLPTFSSLFYNIPANNSFCLPNDLNSEIERSQLQLEQYQQIFKVLKTILEETNKAIKGIEKLKNNGTKFERAFKKKQRMIFNMREELIEARMTPLSNLFNRFPQLIEQLANSYEKKVKLKISGANILVDKAIEQKLYQPLLHLVRNAFSHGIETEEIRLKAKKIPIGEIGISAYYQGSKTVVAVTDDGQGIDLEKIKKRAIERNLITPEKAKKLSEAQILEYMFETGFSTASAVDRLSGRGVGLDIVRAQIEALKGNITISTKPQQGTTFCLQIPLTLSIAKLMVCQARGITYSIVSDLIQKIIQPHPNQIEIFQQQKILHLNTETEKFAIPVYKLSELIRYSKASQKRLQKLLPAARNQRINPIVLLKQNDSFLGLEVDRVLGKQELVIRPLGSVLTPPSFVYGCSILSNSNLSLVIDGIALIKKMGKKTDCQENTSYLTTASKQLPANNLPRQKLLVSKPKTTPVLLVIEDAINSQQNTATILQEAGYQIIRVKDGVAALEQLERCHQIEAIFCDLDLPRTNGFEFLRALKQHPNSSHIRAIVLSSNDNQTYRDLALQLGASAFLNKPCSPSNLLNTLETIL